MTQLLLFTAPKTKKERLYDFIKERGRVRTSDVIEWGTKNFFNRALRTAYELATEGKIWRMRQDLQRMVFGETHQRAWSVFESDRAIISQDVRRGNGLD
jgi:hypothetical protein